MRTPLWLLMFAMILMVSKAKCIVQHNRKTTDSFYSFLPWLRLNVNWTVLQDLYHANLNFAVILNAEANATAKIHRTKDLTARKMTILANSRLLVAWDKMTFLFN